MLRTVLCTAALAVFALTAQAQKGPKPTVQAGKAVDTAGKATIPVGPVLAGEERLSAQERAERTFLMPPRKKMPSVQPPAPPADATSSAAVAIGPPTVEEVAEETAKADAAKAETTAHRSTSRRHYSSRHRSSRSSSARHSSSRKKSTTRKKKTSRRR